MGSEKPLISIVIPVYNVEKYLEECVESVLSQTYKNIEIVLIDDESTDNSGRICDRYSEQYSSIRTVHQVNKGLGGARNTGIKNGQGEFFAFVDSDDYLSPVFVECLYNAIEGSQCKMSCVRYGTEFFDNFKPVLCDSVYEGGAYDILLEEEYQKELLYQKSANGTVWRLVHRSLLSNNLFPEKTLFEDLATTYRITRGIGNVAVLKSKRLYAYRQREDGIMRRDYSSDKLQSCLSVTKAVFCDIKEWYPQLEKAAASRCFAVNRVVFSQIPLEETGDRELIWKELSKYRGTVLKDPEARKREKLAAFIASLGIMPFTFFCKLYRSILHAQ